MVNSIKRRKKTAQRTVPRKNRWLRLLTARFSLHPVTVKKSSKSTNPRKRKMLFMKLQKLVVATFVIGAAGSLVFIAVRSVLLVKGRQADDSSLITEESTGDIVGIPGVPAFPGATFMFKSHINEDMVQSFLRKGQSAYVLPTDIPWEDVVSFYNEQLPPRGWRHVLTVELADKDRMFGEYWVFEAVSSDGTELTAEDTSVNSTPEGTAQTETEISAEASPIVKQEIDISNSYGLRIYNKARAVWYERIAYDEAISGLSNEVTREKEIDLILTLGSTKDLPTGFPWNVKYPELWNVETRESRLMQAPLVQFSGGDLNGTILIEPVAFNTGKSLEDIGREFIAEVNGRRTDDSQLEITATVAQQIAGQTGLVVSLGQSQGVVAIVLHPANGIIYAISSFESDEAYFQYVIEHLEVRQ